MAPASAPRKLIEVALPLDAINAAAAREKSNPFLKKHPRSLHQWWARRPMAAARAVLFAQLVDDPSSHPALFPTPEAQAQERQRLFRIIEQLVQWENTTNETVLAQARAEIRASWRRTCADYADHPRAAQLFDPDRLPAFHDPFAGGGTIPLEAQRLGLEAYASDLNPVAVLINKAMIELPPRFAGQPPVNPANRAGQAAARVAWKGAAGLAEDVRYYGQWLRDEAEQRIGHLYPKVAVTAAMARERPDLQPYVSRELNVIAWLWARTVKSPNPAFAEAVVPLVTTFVLSKKAGKEAYVVPVLENGDYRFTVKSGKPPAEATRGTSAGKRRAFRCLMSGVPLSYDYIKAEGKAGRMGARLLAIVAEGDRERVYLAPTLEHETVARRAEPAWEPDLRPDNPRDIKTPLYGLTTFADLFTARQLVALTTFCDLVGATQEYIRAAALAAGLPDDGKPLREGGTGAKAYTEAVGVYLALAVDRGANYWSTICGWHNSREIIAQTYSRQAIRMTWDFAEASPMQGGLAYPAVVDGSADCIAALPASGKGYSFQQDCAALRPWGAGLVLSTDPPYYDNIGYADLSDFFYVWLRRSLRSVFPDLFATLASPKAEELVATPYRHGSRERAEAFFLDGMTQALQRLAGQAHSVLPVTIYYAFKQSERRGDSDTVSTGWESFLDAVIGAGLGISGTWPLRTEYTSGLKGNVNVLASSIILVCRPRPADAPVATRREFLDALKAELPAALRQMQAGNIAPVDLAQASIGPGMAAFTRYGKVLNADGTPLTVREALALINRTLDEVLAEQEGDLDADTRWALSWFEQSGFAEGEFGVAETLSTARNTSVAGMEEAGILRSGAGKVQLIPPGELSADWDPARERRLTVWEMVHHLVRRLDQGELAAAGIVAKLGSRAAAARELAYRLYRLCDQKNRTQEALGYNALIQSWPEIARLAQGLAQQPQQLRMLE